MKSKLNLRVCMCLLIGLSLMIAHASDPHKSREPYDFRKSEAYQKLSADDREKLEQVRHDQVHLWGALDMYAVEHGGKAPENLDELTPRYLKELPTDPFATAATDQEKDLHGSTTSKGGYGYRYTKGPMVRFKDDNNSRGWVIASVGLPEFPYLAEQGNIGLYVAKGIWQ